MKSQVVCLVSSFTFDKAESSEIWALQREVKQMTLSSWHLYVLREFFSILCAHKKGENERKQGAVAKFLVTFYSIVDEAEAVNDVDGGNLSQRQWKNLANN